MVPKNLVPLDKSLWASKNAGDQIGCGPFVQWNKFLETVLSMAIKFDGDRLSGGTILRGSFVQGDQMSGDQMALGPNASQPFCSFHG